MELMQLASQKNIVHCPYNPAHTMLEKTLSIHLNKCPDKPKSYGSCSFNSLHVMPEKQRKAHEKNCPDRLAFDKMIFEVKDVVRPVTIIEKQPTVSSEESWDDPIESTSSQNLVNIINPRPIIMKPEQGLTKSQRKKYRADLHNSYVDVNMSYNPNLSIHERLSASSSKDNTKLPKKK